MEAITWHPARRGEILTQILPRLEEGAVMVYPTETVYGLGGLVFRSVYNRIYEWKRRPRQRAFILLMPDIRHALKWSDAVHHPRLLQLARAFWPGPLTLVVHASKEVPDFARAEDGTIAMRISPHSFCQALLQSLKKPIVSTSANLHGHPPARTIQEARGMFPQADLFIDGGVLAAGRPSTVLSLVTDPPCILRPGPVTRNQLERVLHVSVEQRA